MARRKTAVQVAQGDIDRNSAPKPDTSAFARAMNESLPEPKPAPASCGEDFDKLAELKLLRQRANVGALYVEKGLNNPYAGCLMNDLREASLDVMELAVFCTDHAHVLADVFRGALVSTDEMRVEVERVEEVMQLSHEEQLKELNETHRTAVHEAKTNGVKAMFDKALAVMAGIGSGVMTAHDLRIALTDAYAEATDEIDTAESKV